MKYSSPSWLATSSLEVRNAASNTWISSTRKVYQLVEVGNPTISGNTCICGKQFLFYLAEDKMLSAQSIIMDIKRLQEARLIIRNSQ